MFQFQAHARLLLAAVCSVVCLSGKCTEAADLRPTPGEVIAVELTSRHFTTPHAVVGIVDERTDESSLWLRRANSGIMLISGYAWERVVHWEPSDIKPAEFEFITHEASVGDPTTHRPVAAVQRRPKVVAIEVYSEVGNWDGDVEADGLRVFLRPIDAFGHTVTVRGHVSFKLLGQRPPWRGNAQLRRRERFAQLGRWSRRVKPERFSSQGSMFQLEFRRFHPDRDFDVATEAILHARLSIPGNGVFETSSAPVLLRPCSWLRDDLEHFTGRRFFAAEHASSLTRP